MIRIITALFITLIGQFCFAQKAKIFKPGKVSLVGYHESINQIHSKGGFTITRADSNFKSSNVYKVNLKSGRAISHSPIPGEQIYNDSGFIRLLGDHRYFFTSNRPTNNSSSHDDWNLFTYLQMDVPLSKDIKPIQELNTNKSECCLVINEKGNAYFSSNRDESWDIFQAQYSLDSLKFVDIRKVEGLSTEEDEWPSFINPANNLIIFSSIRKSGLGGDDLYFAINESGDWKSEIFSDKINTASYEDSGLISPDLKYLYFSSRKADKHGNKDSNIYRIKLAKTKLKAYFERKK